MIAAFTMMITLSTVVKYRKSHKYVALSEKEHSRGRGRFHDTPDLVCGTINIGQRLRQLTASAQDCH
jgi:hypothetical protein